MEGKWNDRSAKMVAFCRSHSLVLNAAQRFVQDMFTIWKPIGIILEIRWKFVGNNDFCNASQGIHS